MLSSRLHYYGMHVIIIYLHQYHLSKETDPRGQDKGIILYYLFTRDPLLSISTFLLLLLLLLQQLRLLLPAGP